jgi:acyl-coenzyme A synthetase/AMP-(fatty) acid ligase
VDGSLVFVDRKKNIIRRSGENISALEVEAVASAHAAIADVIVTSVADDFRGEEVALCVVLKDDTQSSAEVARHIQRHVMQNLAYFKSPGWVVFVEEMPVTASNKPRRAEIKRMAASAVTSGAAHDLRTLKVRQ